MTENEEVMILENLRPGCGEKLSFSEGEICETIDTAISAIKEVQQYREIGIVEECREAVEKQKPKKPRILSSRGGKGGKYCVCPRCNGVTGKYISYCRSCGQAIQWNENLEGMEDE